VSDAYRLALIAGVYTASNQMLTAGHWPGKVGDLISTKQGNKNMTPASIEIVFIIVWGITLLGPTFKAGFCK
jgi:hypothetical protein